MCTNQRWMTSRYSRHKFLVKCGKCEACLQEKAASRSTRIRNHSISDSSYLPLFVTLTYDRSSCPYVLYDDVVNKVVDLPIYRDHFVRRVRCHDGAYHLKRRYNRVVLGELSYPDYGQIIKDQFQNTRTFLPYLKHRKLKIGVCYFKDIQDFHKRLRINLSRKYNYNEKYSFYQCTEYGENTVRPHVHILLFIRPCDEALFKQAIVESWPFADRNRTKNYIEFCHDDAAGYVSAYVNCGGDFPTFLADNFKPKYSHSKYFGHGLESFSLPQILQKVESRDLRYLARTVRDGVRQELSLPIPKYVVNRWFPLFKGYSRLTRDEVYFVLSNGLGYADLQRYQGNRSLISFVDSTFSDFDGVQWYHRVFYDIRHWYFDSRNLDLSSDDVHRFGVRLRHAFENYNRITGRNRFDYAIDYINAWSVYKNTCYRILMEDDTLNVAFKYDNIKDLYDNPSISPDLYDFIMRSRVIPISDPNEFPQVVNKTIRLTKSYHSYLKTRKVNNSVLSQINDCV